MQEKHSGVILRETDVGENDRIITLLTADAGILRAFAKGSKKPKGRLFAPTRLFSYGDFVLYRGKDKYIVTEATRRRGFFGRIDNIEKLALAQYVCELCSVAVPQEYPEETSAILRLVLNTLYAIESTDNPPNHIKASFELRLMTLLGYGPQVSNCASCGKEDGGMTFYPGEGVVLCPLCAGLTPGGVFLEPSAKAAMEYVTTCEGEKLFAYRIPQTAQTGLWAAAEQTVIKELERTFKTLDFYHSLGL